MGFGMIVLLIIRAQPLPSRILRAVAPRREFVHCLFENFAEIGSDGSLVVRRRLPVKMATVTVCYERAGVGSLKDLLWVGSLILKAFSFRADENHEF
jgi:hypothetical protein